jgi:TPR repeat protein
LGYKNGEGVSKNTKEAVKWLRKAAEQGHQYAKKTLSEIGETR